MSFEPIAIVGRSCILPGAATPAALFELVLKGGSAIASVPKGRWGVETSRVLGKLISSDKGGYVTGFAPVSSPIAGKIAHLERLDPLVAWLLSCAKGAIADAGLPRAPESSALIVGNLSYPSEAMTRYVEAYWLAQRGARHAEDFAQLDPRNRFCSGLPVHLAAQALGFEGPAFALDAACASSLYAIKLACDRLHDREVDFALAGGMARADDLFIHLGFTALQALSPTGQSRPFHAAADGLVPGEGAALVALRRLDDAVAAGERILGVIRGIGLSNDGRQNGFLAPAAAGQAAAMRSAYEQSGLDPADLQYIECHATGTTRGDAIEIESLAGIFTGGAKPAIGSLKGNIGHTITASGAASLIKMLSAFEAGVLPPSVCESPARAVREAGFEVPVKAAPWSDTKPRRAAISNFGFGGNNAHLIVEEWRGEAPRGQARVVPREPIAIVAMGVIAGNVRGAHAFARALLEPGATLAPRVKEIALPLEGLAFPPNDLKASLAQQTAILAALEDALADAPALPPARTGVLVGMGCDTSVARHGLRLKIAELLGCEEDDPAVETWRTENELAAPRLTAAGVIGTMPNIPANRVHAARNFTGWGFTVASEELSGLDALDIAKRALRAGELDAAIVGAADFSCEGAHAAALKALVPDASAPGDAAIVFVLMRAKDAETQGARVLALVGDSSEDANETQASAPPAFGHAHAASGLLRVAAAIVEAGARVSSDGTGIHPALGSPGARTILARSFSGRKTSTRMSVPPQPLAVPFAVPRVLTFAASNRAALLGHIARNEQNFEGTVRLALIADSEVAFDQLKDVATDALRSGRAPGGPGIFYGEGTLEGEVAFCFTGAAAIYPNAAREFFLAFPEIGDAIAARFSGTAKLAKTLHGSSLGAFTPTTQLTACALVCQAHAEFTRSVLGLSPQAAIGLSSGETNALLAFGVWRDLDRMLGEIDASGLYDPELNGACLAAREYWKIPEEEPFEWRCWRLAAPLDQVRLALKGEDRCFLTIIHTDEDCVIGGEAEACDRVIERVGKLRAIPLGLDMIVHCAALAPFAETWHLIHSRETHDAAGVRFYTSAGNRAYQPARDTAAAAITQQALETIDFPKTIEQAYADGVRVFIEHGPRGILTSATQRILENRPHLAVALDRREGFGIKGMTRSLLQLWAAGVPMKIAALTERLSALQPRAAETRRMLSLPAHPPDIAFSNAPKTLAAVSAANGAQRMAPPHEAEVYDLTRLFRIPVAAPARREAQPVAVSAREGAVVRLFSDVVQAHRSFLAQQKALHEQFLATRAGIAAHLKVIPGFLREKVTSARQGLTPSPGPSRGNDSP